jgi:hypothetical protein
VRSLFLGLVVVVAAGSGVARGHAAPPVPPPPVAGAFVNIEPTSGATYYREPGQVRRTRLTTEVRVPVDTIVDASTGRMGLTSADGSADFYGGAFVIREPKGQHITQLFLAGGTPGACKAGSTVPIRELWGNGQGNFQTRGLYAAATVRGTVWRVQDRCDGTLTTVARGVVAVRDFRLRRTVLVSAGQSYLARR